jgi:cell wall-associated NlpC family hydrolase
MVAGLPLRASFGGGDYVMDDFRQQIATLAKQYARAKVPFQHRGMSRNGCDCHGLIISIMREIGHLKKYKLPQYKLDWSNCREEDNRFIKELSEFGHEVPNKEAGIGDVAVMKYGRHLSHCGIIVETNSLFVHCLKAAGKCNFGILKNSGYSKRWLKTFRLDEEKIRNYV